MKRLLPLLVVFGLYHCFSVSTAYGQSSNCTAPWYCSWYSFSSGCVPAPPQGTFSCQNIGPWAFVCGYFTTACAPADAKEETCPTCGTKGSGGGSGGSGDISGGGDASGGISFVSGNTSVVQADVRIPGLSNGLMLTRTWNSKWPSSQSSFQVGLFGPNWRSTYEERVFVGGDN